MVRSPRNVSYIMLYILFMGEIPGFPEKIFLSQSSDLQVMVSFAIQPPAAALPVANGRARCALAASLGHRGDEPWTRGLIS